MIEKYGEPWFVAKDVAEVLGYRNTDAICKRCKAQADIASRDGSQTRQMTVIPERDGYRLGDEI